MAVGLDLDQYHMKKRVLLLFAPDEQDTRYEEQHAYLDQEQEELDSWKIVVFGLFEDGPSFAEQRAVSHEDSARARDDFGIEEAGFGLRLLDLDGTQILRSDEPLPVADLVEVVERKQD